MLAAIAAFNLICSGTSTAGAILDLDKPRSAVQLVLRIDLEKNRWCSGDCSTTSEIQDVRETKIIFRMSEDDQGDDLFYVDRETGDFLDRKRSFAINWIILAQGNCEKAAFTGFPARKF
ncbi:hypothetical protein V6U71_05925 [Sphingopyxis sp. J-6]|uniref:hypothetical protein n=1 Tax=Sphingopyxis sp. J-6 TaxID=3122054 RepID=UPI003983F513